MIHGMVQPGRTPAGTPAEGNHRRRRHEARGLPRRQDLRPAHADQPRVLAATGNRPRAADHPGDGPADAAGQGPAGADRGPAANRQDDPPAAHQPGDLPELSRHQADRPADRRAARGSHRLPPRRGQRRGRRQQPRPRHRKPRPAQPNWSSSAAAGWPRWARTSSC